MREVIPVVPIRIVVVLTWFLVLAACEPAPRTQGADSGGDEPRPLAAPTLAEAESAGAARLQVIYVPSSGFAYHDEQGHLTGVTVELIRDFGRWLEETREMNVDVEFIPEERWAAFYERVRDSRGGVFGIGNVTITEERRSEIDFSPPYLTNVAILMTHENVPELQSIEVIAEAFAGMTGLIYPGTLHETRIEALRRDHFTEMETVEVASNGELVGLVTSSEGYFGYVDIYNYWAAREEGAPLRHHPVGDDASETFGVILPRDSGWTPLLESFFEADGPLLESERHQVLLREHLGEELAALLRSD